MIGSERTPAQRAMDDELAYLAQCGLLPDPRDEEEWEDWARRFYDRDPFAPVALTHAGANTPTSTPPHIPAGGGSLRAGRPGGGASGSPKPPRGTAGPAEPWEIYAWQPDLA